VDSHLVIVDVVGTKQLRIINVYRCFNPQDGSTAREKFISQLLLIKSAFIPGTIIMGDFNLDANKQFQANYTHKVLFEDLESHFSELGLIQLVEFDTWSRTVENTKRSSLLDHIYTDDPTRIKSIYPITPIFGDHLMVVSSVIGSKGNLVNILRRDWRKYSPNLLCEMLRKEDWNIGVSDVQGYWNCFENKLINIVDQIVPLRTFTNNHAKNSKCPSHIKKKLNKRKRLLQTQKNNPTSDRQQNIKILNKEIRYFFNSDKRKNVRRGIIPGNSGSLWCAVNIAKDVNNNNLPGVMFKSNEIINGDNLAEEFASYFNTKVLNISSETLPSDTVYNGKRKVVTEELNFMTELDIKECILSLKIKNSEGVDRLPQRILIDGINVLLCPLTGLFDLIYRNKKLPLQWLVSKIIPVHKEGPKHNVKNYRPIANLCSSSKVFEKLILKRIQAIELQNGVDITGKQQHGFKKNHSTLSLGIQIQSLIARALDEDSFVLMASLDLSAAFDIVDVNLLIKRLTIIGLPPDIISLIRVWLSDRCCYVNINNNNSYFYDSLTGTVQGSILGPILYAIYISPLFDICKITSFADDNYVLNWSKNKNQVTERLTDTLTVVVKWLKDSGLKVNESKTELCLFHRKDTQPVQINLSNILVRSKPSINVLGVIFDSKLQWVEQVSKAVRRANSALHAIRLIRKFFTTKELLQLLTANFYSILYYNSEIWHINKLSHNLKQILLSTSAKALKLCQKHVDNSISFINLHRIHNRATPDQMLKYKHALLLYSVYNNNRPNMEWLMLNFQQILTSRQTNFEFIRTNHYRVGQNILINRLSTINRLIPLEWVNLSKSLFKINCKNKFLSITDDIQ
jgi:hypothetical protein